MPSAEEFRKLVEKHRKKYGKSEQVYNKCIEEFGRVEISQLNEKHDREIFGPFLFKWGRMQRRLGWQGIKSVREKLVNAGGKIKHLRDKDLLVVNLDQIKELIIDFFGTFALLYFLTTSTHSAAPIN